LVIGENRRARTAAGGGWARARHHGEYVVHARGGAGEAAVRCGGWSTRLRLGHRRRLEQPRQRDSLVTGGGTAAQEHEMVRMHVRTVARA